MKRTLLIILAASLMGCADKPKTTPKKKSLNKIQKFMCVVRLRNQGCYDYIEREQS